MKTIDAYLTFDGNCRQAMTFYQKALGGELFIQSFADAKVEAPKGMEGRIMHARLANGAAVLMASDSMPGTTVKPGDNISLALGCESMQEIDKLFAALGEKGKVTMPLQDTFWGARFGMLTDQFGIHWMFNYELPKKQ
jgi:PhnB protein